MTFLEITKGWEDDDRLKDYITDQGSYLQSYVVLLIRKFYRNFLTLGNSFDFSGFDVKNCIKISWWV